MWLEKAGIYGMENIEDILLAGIVIGDPVLLIGPHGAAKTTLCRKIAQMLNLKFHAYDASKALFEDIIGFPNPDSIAKGMIEYVPTPLSIWDKEFILIDEISRARAESQNKWLEVIRSRKIMGMNINKLKYIFAAMNPPSYLGVNPLDEALAGRFTFIVKIPNIVEMNDDNVKKIINNINEDDGRGLIKDGEKKLTIKQKKDFYNFIIRTRKQIKKFDKNINDSINEYLLLFMRFADARGIMIDGRRLNMIKRNILAYFSVLLCGGKISDVNLKKSSEHLFKVIKYSLPFDAINLEITDVKIKSLHNLALDYIDNTSIISVFNIKNSKDVYRLDNNIISNNYPSIKSAITKVISALKSKENYNEKPLYFNILRAFVKRIYNGEIILENNDVERIFEAYNSIFDMSIVNNYKNSGLNFYVENIISGVIENDKNDINVFKFILNLYCNKNIDSSENNKFKENIKIYRGLIFGGDIK